MVHAHRKLAGKFGIAGLFALIGAMTLSAASAANQASPDSERFIKKIVLPERKLAVVVSEGEFEARSIGSYCIRLYDAEDLTFPTDSFLAGRIEARDGSIESVLMQNVDGDGQEDVVVTVRCAGSGQYLSADAFSIADKKVTKIASVSDLDPHTDVMKELRLKPRAQAHAESMTATGYAEVLLGDSIPVLLEKLTKLNATASDLSGKAVNAGWWKRVLADENETGPCLAYITISLYPDLLFAVEDNKIVRVDAPKAGVPNALNIPLGTSVRNVKKLYPNVKFEDDKYADVGDDFRNAFIPFPSGKGGWRITEKNGVVIEIRVGLKPAIQYRENG